MQSGFAEAAGPFEGERDGDALAGRQRVDGPLLDGQEGRLRPSGSGPAEVQLQPDAAAVRKIRDTYVKAMELFANDGLLIPEQVWDGVGAESAHGYARGEGTDSATPLAWSHAEYVKLLRSVSDGQVWDNYAPVKARFSR